MRLFRPPPSIDLMLTVCRSCSEPLSPLKNAHIFRFLSTSFIHSYHLKGAGVKTMTSMSQPLLSTAIVTDVPRAMGGKNEGPQPIELFLASLCGCELVTAQFVARNMKPRVTIDRIDFDVHASRDQRGAVGLPLGSQSCLPFSRLEKIWGSATLHTSASPKEVAVLAAEVKRRCPIANMVVLSGCTLDIEFTSLPTKC